MELSEVERERLSKLDRLRAAGIDPYPPRCRFVHQRVMAADAVQRALEAAQRAMDGETADAAEVAVMGRVVARRVMGKAAFLGIEDASGRVQVYGRVGKIR
jgi:lysyl-tRNA synthetase class 2